MGEPPSGISKCPLYVKLLVQGLLRHVSPSGTAAEGVLRVLGVGYSSKDWEPLRAEPAGDLQDQDGGQRSSRLLSTQGLLPADTTSCLNPGTAPTLTSGS